MNRIAVTILALLAPVLAAVPMAGPGYAAGETCDGRAATIVVPGDPNGPYPTAPVTGTPGDDVIVGTPVADTIDGAGGNDVICGLAGADDLTGGEGNDRLFGGLDAEYFPDDGYWADVITPGPGDDHIDLGADPDAEHIHWVDFGSFDRVRYEGAAGPVLVDLTAGRASGEGSDTIVVGGPAGVIGSAFDDRITGSAYDDLLQAGPGDDLVEGLAGDDVIAVDAGRWRTHPSDVAVVDEGDDVADGGADRDTLMSYGGTDVLAGGADKDSLNASMDSLGSLRGGAGDDRLTTWGPVDVSAGSGDDEIGYIMWPGFRNEVDGDGGRDSLSLLLTTGFATGEKVRVHRPRNRITFSGSSTRIRYDEVEEFVGKGRYARWTFVGTRADERFLVDRARSVRAFARGGDDDLTGTGGRDLLDGGRGRDRAYGGAGRDTCVSIEQAVDCEITRP